MTEETLAAEAAPEVVSDEIETNEEEILVESDDSEVVTEVDEGEETELTEEQEEELVGEVADAIEDGATKEEVKELIRTFKYKANGKTKEITLDLNNEEEIIRKLQLADAAQPAMQESAETKKMFEDALRELKNDPWSVLRELGHDTDELAEAYIQEKIEEMKKTPEQIAQEEMEKELNDLREKLKKEEEAKQEAEYKRLQKEAEVELENQIIEAISSTTQLPKAPFIIKRVADAMLFAMDNGYPNVTAEQVLPSVESEINREYQDMIDQMPDQVLEKFIGKKVSERLRGNRLKKMKKAPKTAKITETAKAVQKDEKKEEKIPIKDFLKRRLSE